MAGVSRIIAVVALLALCATKAMAILPDNGWYWNPAESGRGFNIEVQNNLLFAAGFIYDNAGNPVWVTTGGTMSSDHTYSGDLVATSGGQCLGCAYRPPGVSKIGNITITFPNSTTAAVNIDGTVLNLQREAFGLDFSSLATPLLGEWATTEGDEDAAVYFGDRLLLTGTQNLQAGLTAVGYRAGDPSSTLVGQFTAGAWGILLDTSPGYWKLYTFGFSGFNNILGIVSVFPKNSQPSGFLEVVGQRIESGAAAAGGNAPGLVKSLSPAQRERLDVEEYELQKAQGKALDPRVLEMARALLKIAPH